MSIQGRVTAYDDPAMPFPLGGVGNPSLQGYAFDSTMQHCWRISQSVSDPTLDAIGRYSADQGVGEKFVQDVANLFPFTSGLRVYANGVAGGQGSYVDPEIDRVTHQPVATYGNLLYATKAGSIVTGTVTMFDANTLKEVVSISRSYQYGSNWDHTFTYGAGDYVLYSNLLYVSITSPNLNNIPSTSPAYWTPLFDPRIYFPYYVTGIQYKQFNAPVSASAYATNTLGLIMSQQDSTTVCRLQIINYTSSGVLTQDGFIPLPVGWTLYQQYVDLGYHLIPLAGPSIEQKSTFYLYGWKGSSFSGPGLSDKLVLYTGTITPSVTNGTVPVVNIVKSWEADLTAVLPSGMYGNISAFVNSIDGTVIFTCDESGAPQRVFVWKVDPILGKILWSSLSPSTGGTSGFRAGPPIQVANSGNFWAHINTTDNSIYKVNLTDGTWLQVPGSVLGYNGGAENAEARNIVDFTRQELIYFQNFTDGPGRQYNGPYAIAAHAGSSFTQNLYRVGLGFGPEGLPAECFKIKCIPFTVPATPGIQTYTFSATRNYNLAAIQLYVSTAATADTATAEQNLCIGAADGSNQWAFTHWHNSASNVMHMKRFAANDCCVAVSVGGVILARATFAGFVPNGFKLNWTDVDGNAYKGFAIGFVGDKLRAAVGTLDGVSATGSKVQGLAFKPEFLFAASSMIAFGSNDTSYGVAQGFAENLSGQQTISPYAGYENQSSADAAVGFKHFTNTDTDAILKAFLPGDTGVAVSQAISVDSWQDDGFTLKAINSASAATGVGYLAFTTGGQAVVQGLTWDLSDTGNGLYTKLHGNYNIIEIEGLFSYPVSGPGDSANQGCYFSSGDVNAAVFSRGSCAASANSYEQNSYSDTPGIVFTREKLAEGDLTITPLGFVPGGLGWKYQLSGGPQHDRKFITLVVGRVANCYPTSWTQGQIMEDEDGWGTGQFGYGYAYGLSYGGY